VKVRPVPTVRAGASVAIGIASDRTRRSARPPDGGPPPPWDFLASQGFTGGVGECVGSAGEDGEPVFFVGLGPAAEVDTAVLRSAAAVAARSASRVPRLALDLLAEGAGDPDVDGLRAIAEGAVLGGYRWAGHRSDPPKAKLRDLQIVDRIGQAKAASKGAVAAGCRAAEAANLARDLVNEPGGTLTAPEFAARAAIAASEGGVSCTVHDEAAIRELGFGGLLAVNQGSFVPPRFVELAYDPADADEGTPVVALVGKGITFDSGGYSIKTSDGMTTMKSDMGGGAAIVATLTACADLGIPVSVRGFIPLTDNMIGGDALRVGDVITHVDGTTTEVLNTDAEGRLILSDVLAWATARHEDRPRPAAVIDLATLTGACMVALGTRTAGLFANDDTLAGSILDAADRAGERCWRLPLMDLERKGLESKVADRKNIAGRYGGAIVAALYLRDFVADGVPWAHLDIAGPAFNEAADELEVPSGGTGFAVRTLLHLLETWPG
jgi:leucyl aminopeptidase